MPVACDEDLERFVAPYSNYWHHENNWPVGWHSVLTLNNNTRQFVTYTLKHIPYYGAQFDAKTGKVTRYQEQLVTLRLKKGEERTVTLQDLFGWADDQMSSMDGCLLVKPSAREARTRTDFRFSVVPNASGQGPHSAIR